MSIPRWVWIAAAIVALYLLWRFMGSSMGQQYGLIKVTYDRIGQARDAFGTPFNSPGMNPGR